MKWKFFVLSILSITLLAILSFSSLQQAEEPVRQSKEALQQSKEITQQPEKDIFLQTAFNMPNNNKYKKLWQKVDSLEKKQLPKSAAEVVNEIYAKAKVDNNAPQRVKALIHQLKYIAVLEAVDQPVLMQRLESEIAANEPPVSNVLHSMLAEAYWQYFQNNRYKFYNRTETVNFDNDDILTWSLAQIFEKIITEHQLALQNESILKKIPVEQFKDIIILALREKNGNPRPTLFDFLANRAIDFYQNDESSINKPVYEFQLSDDAIFKTSQDFINHTFEAKEQTNLKLAAVKTFQKLEAFHQNDKDKLPLIETILRRLNFGKSQAVYSAKDIAYEQALEKLIEQYKKNSAYTQAAYELANYLNSKTNERDYDGNQLQKTSNQKEDYRKRAWQICTDAVNDFPESYGAQNCKALINQIETKDLNFEIEDANLPNQAFRALLSYKNLNKVFLKIVKVKYEESLENKEQNKPINWLNKQTVVNSWDLSIPDPKDYLSHSVEFKVDELELGYYYLMVSDNADFNDKKNAVAFKGFWVTELATFNRKLENGNTEIFVVDRDSGKPIPQVICKVYEDNYDRTIRLRSWKLLKTITTNEQGKTIYPSTNKYGRLKIELNNEDDLFVYKDRTYRGYSKINSEPYTRVNWFTDRSIYRPGQTVYFKGIVITSDDKKHNIEKNKNIKVTLRDVNWQEVEAQNFTTNEYGSFNGSFTLPQGGLTGQFEIESEFGNHSISVEEYKRPRFEANFDTIKGSYALNETVAVTGKANTYAGAVLDEVEVEYTVERTYYFPYQYYWWSWRRPQRSNKTIIKNGKTKTDENGNFTVDFEALPDLSIDEKQQPIFTYKINAKVMDSTGETQECNTTVKAGYVALEVSINVPETVGKEDTLNISINTKNLNGNFEPADISVAIRKIEEPNRLLRKRYWQQPDQFVISKKDYIKYFPYDVYADENLLEQRKRGATLKNINKTTTKDFTIELPDIKNWQTGKYEVKLTAKDKNGKDIELMQVFQLQDLDSNVLSNNEICSFKVLNSIVEVGNEVEVLISTADENVQVFYTLEHQNNLVKDEWISVPKGQKIINIPVEEKHQGNFTIHLKAIKHNRIFSLSETIAVPYPSKKLDMEFISFRDKLQPNQAEQWKIKIRGPEGEMVAAEMVAAMYDASLDAFKPHNWYFNIDQKTYSSNINYTDVGFAFGRSQLYADQWNNFSSSFYRDFDKMNWFGLYFNYEEEVMLMESVVTGQSKRKLFSRNAKSVPAPQAMDMMAEEMEMDDSILDEVVGYNNVSENEGEESSNQKEKFKNVSPRTNLSETAFFMPKIETDQEGNVVIAFDAPEALTRWKFLGFAHTQDLNFGQIEEAMTTQKELMITPNAPRFFREGDQITFTGNVNNLSDKTLQGEAVLQLFDATTMQAIDTKFKNSSNQKTFNVEAGRSNNFEWTLNIPDDVEAVTYKVLAKAGKQSDGEQNSLPVLKNRMLVTETMPLPVRAKQSKNFVLGKMQNHGSSTLKHHSYTLEFTSNPAWYAVQALPYLMEYPHDCAEQIFSRIYANSLASHIANANPKIQQVFNSWKETESDALVSNLEKNQKLKALLLEETPWVLQANDESERKKRVGLLFDLNKMSGEYASNVNKLLEMQMPSGAFPWFDGMRENRYITQHIINGFGKLDALGVEKIRSDNRLWNAIGKAIQYLDEEIRDNYEDLKKRKNVDLSKNHIDNIQVHYLYMRSFFKDIEVASNAQKAFDYYKGQIEEYWTDFGIYQKGLVALALNRFGNDTIPNDIVKSLKEFALEDEEMGSYFKYDRGYYWHQAPIETQALMIEVFEEVAQDQPMVEDLKVWLLKQKQTQDWKTTKATVEAIYALLRRGSDMLTNTKMAEIKLGGKDLDLSTIKAEEGTGYFQKSWVADELDDSMAEISVNNPNDNVAWGAVYWQYFEQLDKITFAETPLSLKKQLFKEIKSDTGKKIEPLAADISLNPGDKVTVRIELRVDRAMDYVHIKDMRAACFEPTNVISQYKYQDGLGYYQSTKDASTNFFMDRLNPGTYVFEYRLKVYHKGDFSNGVTSIQCMYAPEFSSHSEGVRVLVE